MTFFFFFGTCVYLFGVVILHTWIRLFDIIILCTGVCLCDMILCVLGGASTGSCADGCACSVMPLCVTLITFLLCFTKRSLQRMKTTFKPWHSLLPLPQMPFSLPPSPHLFIAYSYFRSRFRHLLLQEVSPACSSWVRSSHSILSPFAVPITALGTLSHSKYL